MQVRILIILSWYVLLGFANIRIERKVIEYNLGTHTLFCYDSCKIINSRFSDTQITFHTIPVENQYLMCRKYLNIIDSVYFESTGKIREYRAGSWNLPGDTIYTTEIVKVFYLKQLKNVHEK